MTSPVVEERFLSHASLARRWDCSIRTVYRALDEMRRLGMYSGTRIGGPKVRLSAVEAYEAWRAQERAPARLPPLAAPALAVVRSTRPTSPASRRRSPTTSSSPGLLPTFLAAARSTRGLRRG